MPVHAVLVDDSEEDLKHAQRLTRGGLTCEPLPPPETTEELRQSIDERRKAARCDIVLLDYRLDAESTATGGTQRRYRGGTVAALLKEFHPDLPVVLFTTEEKLRRSLSGNPQVKGLFDHLVLKQRLASRFARPAVIEELTDLAEGFKVITEAKGSSWARLSELLKAEGDAAVLEGLEMANPPGGVTEVAQWILHDLLAYPALLVDERDASAILGLTVSAFRRGDVQEALGRARYVGVFSSWNERWWRGRLQRWLTQAAGDQPGVSGAARARVIADAVGVPRRAIRSASCIWCGRKNVARACSICREPVDPEHGLIAAIDERPRWAEAAVACFACISNGSAKGLRFQPGTEGIVQALERGQLTSEVADGG